MVLGRARERERVEGVIDAALAGHGESLAVLGETGIGKTTLLDHAAGYAAEHGARVHRATGVEAEMFLPFSGLHQLLAPLLAGIDDLPRPQRFALARAFGLAEGPSPKLLLVGLAALSLVEAAALEAPLLCLVDDVQWLDHSSAVVLTVISRRLASSRVALIFGVREPVERRLPLAGLPELRLRGLSQEESGELIRRAVGGHVAEGVLGGLTAETGGNPSALRAIAQGLTAAQLAGTSMLPTRLPSVGFDLEHGLLRRLRQLPTDTQTLLLLVAAERAGDAAVLSRAADRLGITPDAVDAAEEEGLVAAGSRITLRHPALRAAIYQSARARERRRVHRVLAAVTHGDLESDERTWHRAAASVVPNETIAAELERWSARLIFQLAYGRAAELLKRAAQLTPDPGRRARRALAAARAELDAGSPAKALEQLDSLALDQTNPITVAQALRLRASIDATLESGAGRPTRLLEAARALEPLDARESRAAYLDSMLAAVEAGELGAGPDVVVVAQASRAAPRIASSKQTANDLLLDGLASLFLEGHRVAAPALRAAVDGLRADDTSSILALGCRAAAELWDDEALRELAVLHVDRARTAEASSALPDALAYLGGYEVMAGRLDVAEAHFDEADERDAALLGGAQHERRDSGRLLALAWRGREDETRSLAETAKRNAAARGLGGQVSLAHHALCVLELGHRRYGAALSAAHEALRSPTPFSGVATLPDLVEAAVRADMREDAVAGAEHLEESASASRTEWGAGMLARTRALLAEDEEAEALYLDAIDHLKHCRVTPQLARTRLLYGEWLRRERRQRDAREELREAARMFSSMGAEAFARRAEDELSATGERLITRGPETFEVLTAQETQIAELAADGESNREIASRLYVSPRTIEYHLRKIFKKVGVSGRMELAQQLRAGSVDRGEDAAKELSLDGDEPGTPVEAPSGSVVGLDDDQ